MKKVFVFAAALAAFALTACNEVSPKVDEPQQELALVNAAQVTKGYVEGATFVDSPYDKLHGQTPDGKTDRAMLLSAYLTPQSGAAGDYFVGQTFSKNANGETDNMWHHNPKVYWPIGGTLDFLAISSTLPFSGTVINWNPDNAAQSVVLTVGDKYLQDDIIYGAVVGRTTNAGAPVTMTFNHTQAWIQFQIKVDDDSMNDIVKINDITLKNIYTRGELTLNGGSTPSAVWDFGRETAIDKAMDDTYQILAPNYISDQVGYMDMLVPAQAQTEFVMHYTLEGQENVLEYSYPLATAQWEKGKKYIYEITIKPYEITVNPLVTDFVVVDPGATGFPSVIE